MAKLVIVTHEYDVFAYRRRPGGPIHSPYLLFDLLPHLESLGHSGQETQGPIPVAGDVALLHVDATIVEKDYLALASNYGRAINFGTGDISKRAISSLRLSPGDSWDGRVIVKANLNAGGNMEEKHNNIARRKGRPEPHPGVTKVERYEVLERLDEIAEQVWSDPALVVERFLPEPDPDGFALRTWVFMGRRERCTRTVAPTWIVKAGDAIRYEPVEVPDQLRAERERLNFDFGKFDFVMHEGAPVLLDTNRTPGTARAIEPLMKGGARNLAEGLDELMRGVA